MESWTAVDDHLAGLLAPEDDALRAAREASAAAGLPPHDVSALQGALLHLLARLARARRILELGTLGGYSAIWLARALPPGGRLVSLELDPHYAEVARGNVARAGLADRVEVLVGPALDTLTGLTGPFELIFLDADKAGGPAYLEHALRLSAPGTVLVADNVVRGGAVLEPRDPSARGVRRLLELLAAEPRVTATALQTVGHKGHDGFAIGIVGDAA